MVDLLHDLSATFEQGGIFAVLGSILVMGIMGVIFYAAAKANQEQMDQHKQEKDQ